MTVTITGKLIDIVLTALAKFGSNHLLIHHQKQILITWLRSNTRDEPGESHKDVSDIAYHLGLSIEEVNNLVFRSNEIFRSQSNPSLISIWRDEPQSVYEKRGILMI